MLHLFLAHCEVVAELSDTSVLVCSTVCRVQGGRQVPCQDTVLLGGGYGLLLLSKGLLLLQLVSLLIIVSEGRLWHMLPNRQFDLHNLEDAGITQLLGATEVRPTSGKTSATEQQQPMQSSTLPDSPASCTP